MRTSLGECSVNIGTAEFLLHFKERCRDAGRQLRHFLSIWPSSQWWSVSARWTKNACGSQWCFYKWCWPSDSGWCFHEKLHVLSDGCYTPNFSREEMFNPSAVGVVPGVLGVVSVCGELEYHHWHKRVSSGGIQVGRTAMNAVRSTSLQSSIYSTVFI